jgi:glycosyltransferase involved in cell wall biosynthesis
MLPPGKRKYISFSVLRRVLKLHKQHDKTIIDYPWFGLYFLPLRVLLGKRYEVRELDIQFLRFRGFGKWYWPLMYVFEYLVYRLSDRLRCISSHDMAAARRYFKIKEKKCIVEAFIPDARRFYPSEEFKAQTREKLGLAEDEAFILFYGKLDYRPNLEAVRYIKEEIIPLLNQYGDFKYRVVIAGLNPPRITDPRIIYTGFIEHIERYVQSCDVMINPVTLGGGVKTKVLEALACGKPVVSTENGARGIEGEFYKGRLYICGDTHWGEFARKTVDLACS